MNLTLLLQRRFLLLAFLCVVCYCSALIAIHLPDRNLHMIFCDVGQGDAILLTQGSWQMLVDGGPDTRGALDCLHRHLPWWERKLEYVVATHSDADHIGGLATVLRSYQTKTILINGDSKETTVFTAFYEALQREMASGNRVISVALGDRLITADGVEINALSPRERRSVQISPKGRSSETTLQDKKVGEVKGKEDANDRSIVLNVAYQQVSILLTGDAPSLVEQALCQQGLLRDTTILKVGHHGSKTSTDPCLLIATSPEISILSVGKNNRYGHPSLEVINRLRSSGSQIMRTDEQGSIELVTNGRRVWKE